MSSELLDEAYDQKFIDAADYEKYRAGYTAQQVFIDSQRLNGFRYDLSSRDIDAPHGPRLRGAAAGIAIEAAITAHEWDETRQRAQVFRDTLHNDTASTDAYLQQGAQITGALAGTAAGGATAVALGTGTGGTALLVAGEGYLFGKAAERGVELWQQHSVYNISSEGVDWSYNGRQWIRDDLRADLVDDARDLPQRQDFAAPLDKARELSAMASVVAVERALGQVPTPRDPFVQPAGDGGEPWRYRPDRGAWAREVVTAYDINNQPSARDTVDANGEQAARLSAEAMRIIDRNLAAGPAGIAAQYQIGHKAHGYDQTPAGTMPEAVTTALNPDLLQASDGRHYRRDAQGAWTHAGKTADATRALELELTRERLLPALQDHQQQLDRMPTWQPPTPEAQDKALLREAYRHHGIERETRQEYFDASYLAVQRTRAETGLTAATTSLVLGQDASGRFTPDSPIHHLRMDGDGTVRIAEITTPEDIARALADVRARDRSEHIAPTDDAAIRARPSTEQAEPAARAQHAPLINAPTHPDARMYQSILHHVQTEDRRRGREPDDISERLAAGLTVDAKARGLQTIGFFRMSDDGTRAFMADTPDPNTPWARTAVSDIAAAVRQDLQASSEKVADINLQQGMHPAQQQSIQAQEAAGAGRPRMA
ncbi:XVIPCD domain-containing protein [Lysobacter brunescens]|uniref:XVIPCD domain-containing protein n=1 Tax=Lysobacter brunescens TaxID=262323 RepID=A0ABW2YC09_9GAMM